MNETLQINFNLLELANIVIILHNKRKEGEKILNFIKKYLGWFLLGLALLVSKEFIAKYDFFFKAGNKFISVIAPFIIGILIAYISNGVMVFIEKKFNKSRIFSYIATYIIFIGSLLGLVIIVVPTIINNVIDISKQVPEYTNRLLKLADDIRIIIENAEIKQINDFLNKNLSSITEFVMSLFDKGLNSIVSSLSSITSMVTNFVVSIIVSMYVSYDIEGFQKKAFDMVRATIGTPRANKLADILKIVVNVFKNFFSGQALDAVLVAVLCFIGLQLLKVPYSALLSLITAVFNLIPYIGPVLGGIPVVIVAFLDSPQKALWALIFIIVLQQIEGNIIAPKILGDAVGISSFSILLAIALGGAYFGIFGMFLAVPVFKLILMAIEYFVQKRLEKEEMRNS